MKRINEIERKHAALRAQFVALQLVMIKLLPLMFLTQHDALASALVAAQNSVRSSLPHAGFEEADIQGVVEAIDALRDDLLRP